MGRGPTVQAQKDKNAKAKAKINTLHAKLITLAAERGADPTLNTTLADAIHTAKKDGVTADLIDRAVRRGAGLDKDSVKVEEIIYEGFAPGGVALIVRTLTDNRNRTAANIRHIFSAYGGNLGESGTISNFAFEYKGVIVFDNIEDIVKLETAILDTVAEDYHIEARIVTVYVDRTHLREVQKNLESAGFIVERASLEFVPSSYIAVTDFDTALKIYKMLEAFDEDDDVEIVWNNADISDTLWEEVETFVESKKFRT